MGTCTGPILKRMSLLLDYTGKSAPSRICTDTVPILSRLPLLSWATGANKASPRQDLHLHSLRSERSASALGYAGKNCRLDRLGAIR